MQIAMKKHYEAPMCEELILPIRNNLLLNLSAEGTVEDFAGSEDDGF